ncbi:MAG: PepSY-associated TM helix domain-containing protein [Myxococcota bacterium]|nr:PepSY-associated TM helix domain-containing protein [Myxococcota bacterium]
MKTKTLRQLHTWLGLGSALFFLLLGITGVLLTFRGTFRTPPVVVPEAVQLEPPVDVWGIIKRAESDIGAKASSVSFSDTPKKPIRIRMRDEHRSTLYFSLSGVLLETRDRSERSFNGWMFDLHTGAIAGRPGELIIAFLGLILVVSTLTGFLIWPFFVRYKKRRDRLVSQRSPREPQLNESSPSIRLS